MKNWRFKRAFQRSFVWLGGLMGKTGIAAAIDSQRQGIELPIVTDGEHTVKLIEIVPSDLVLFKPADYDHVWCLVVDDSSFTLAGAVDWILSTRDLNMKGPKRFLPTMMLLVDMEKLTQETLHDVSSKLIPSGVLLVRWPKDVASVDEALSVVRSQLEESYGEPNFNQQVKWGHVPVTRSPDLLHAV